MEFAILVFLFGFGIILYAIINWILDNRAPEEVVEATLLRKKTSTMMDANNIMHTDYILVFDINGIKKKFIVPRRIYKQYKENQKGLLTYKRNRFVNFDKIIDFEK